MWLTIKGRKNIIGEETILCLKTRKTGSEKEQIKMNLQIHINKKW